MSEHLSQIQLAGYGGRTLDADELLAVDRHLASCNDCYARFTRIQPGARDEARPPHRSSSESIEEPFHLDYDQHLVAYVDGTANNIDREIVESHVALCSECAEDLRDLQEFRHQPVTTTAVRRSPRKPWMVQWQWPRVWNPQLTTVLVIGILILVMTVAAFLWTTYRMPNPVQQAGNTPSPEADKQIPGDNKESLSPSGPAGNADKVAAQPSPQQPDQPAQPKSREPLIAINDGGSQITLDQNGHLEGLQSLPPDLRKNVEKVLATREFQVSPTLADLSRGSGRLRGRGSDQSTLQPLEPTGRVIKTDRPTFRWSALADARDYVVTIYDSRLRSIQSSDPVAGTEWTASTPLDRGVTYSWQISAVKDGRTVVAPKPPAPESRFRVLDSAGVTEVENTERIHGRSNLVMGVLYSKHGLIDEAEREFEALVRANPESPVAVQLLTNLRSLRRK